MNDPYSKLREFIDQSSTYGLDVLSEHLFGPNITVISGDVTLGGKSGIRKGLNKRLDLLPQSEYQVLGARMQSIISGLQSLIISLSNKKKLASWLCTASSILGLVILVLGVVLRITPDWLNLFFIISGVFLLIISLVYFFRFRKYGKMKDAIERDLRLLG